MTINNLKNNRGSTLDYQRQDGFTLVETMVAVFILSFSIAVFMNVVASGFFSARYARNEIVANFLLQEAVDYVRNDRDTRIILYTSTEPLDNWITFISSYDMCTTATNGCYLDVNTGVKTKCSLAGQDTNCPPFYFHENSDEIFYDYDSTDGALTNFRRQLLVYVNPNNSDEIFVEAYVSWENGNSTKTRSLKTSLLMWQK